MDIQTIDASLLSKMFLSGAKSLEAKKELINELNVFPVPDGDTGTNMTMTIMSAAGAVSELSDPDMKTLSKAISSGSLRGARGNSGVILSQLLRGFTKVVSNYDEITVEILNEARLECSSCRLDFSDIQDVEITINYNLDSVIEEKMNNDNLTLDF